jgi:hypothetical protein
MSSLKTTHLHHNSQKRLSDTISEGSPHNALVDGAEHIASFGGTQAGRFQYSTGGTSAAASGLIALNFARVAFSIEQDGLRNLALLQAVLARECAEVRSSYNPLLEYSLISPGNHRDMRIMVR